MSEVDFRGWWTRQRPDFFAQQTQEWWIARARYEVWELSQRAHESERNLIAYQRATLTFIRNFLPPKSQKILQPMIERLAKVKMTDTGDPLTDGDNANRRRLQILDDINAKVTEEMYKEGLILKHRKPREGGFYPV